MKELIPILKNWRCLALLLCALCAFMCAIAESDSIAALVVSKVAAAALVCVCAALGIHWAADGKINELTNIEE